MVVKGAVHHCWGLVTSWNNTIRQYAHTDVSRLCETLLELRSQAFFYLGLMQHFGKLSCLHNCCGHISINFLFNYQCLLFCDVEGRDASCSANNMKAFHHMVNPQVTTCTVFWRCWTMCLMSFQFSGGIPTYLNTVTKEVDKFVKVIFCF